MLPQGTLSGETAQTSFARYVGLLMILSIIALVFGLTAILVWLDTCTPTLLGTEIVDDVSKLVIRDICVPRFQPGAMAAFMTAAGATFGGTTVFLYRATKAAEVANGQGH